MVQTKQFTKDVEEVIKDTLMKPDFIKSLAEQIAKIVREEFVNKVNSLEKKLKETQVEMLHQNEGKIKILETKISSLEEKLDNCEQKEKENNIRIHGIPERDRENLVLEIIKTINANMNIQITDADIVTCYRIGKKIDDKPRVVLVRFNSFNIKLNIMKNKKNLKGKPINVSEDLIKIRYNKLKQCRNDHGPYFVWTRNGEIFYKDGPDGTVKKLQ